MASAWIQNLNPSSPILKSAQQLHVRQNSPQTNYLVYYQKPSSAQNTNGLSLHNPEPINCPTEILDLKSKSMQKHLSSKCDVSSNGTVLQTDINDNDCLAENQLLVGRNMKVRKETHRTQDFVDDVGNGIEHLVQNHPPAFHIKTADVEFEREESHQEINDTKRSIDVKLHQDTSFSEVRCHGWNNDSTRMISNSLNNEYIVEHSQRNNCSPERLSNGNNNNSKSNIIPATCSTTNTDNKTKCVVQINERTKTPESSFSSDVDSVNKVFESTHEQLLPEWQDQNCAQNIKSITEAENSVHEQIKKIHSVSSQTLQSKLLLKSDWCPLGQSDCSISAQTHLNGCSCPATNQIRSSSIRQNCSANQKATRKSNCLATSFDSNTIQPSITEIHGTDVLSNNHKKHRNDRNAAVLSPKKKQSQDLQTICFVLSILNISKCRDIEADIMVLKDRLRYQGLLTEYLVKKVKLLTQEIRHQKEASLQLSQSVQSHQSHMIRFAHDTHRLLKRQQRVNEQLFTCVQDLKNKHSLQNIMVETAAAMFAMYLASMATNYAVHITRESMLRKHGLILHGSARFKYLMRYLAALQGVLVVRVMSRRTVGACKRVMSWVTERVFHRNWFQKSVSCGSHFQNA